MKKEVQHNDLQFHDIESYEALFKEHYAGLRLFATRILQDQDAAEDVVQEVFLNLWRKRKSLMIKTSVQSYLFSAVRNGCHNNIRHHKIVDRHEKRLLGQDKVENQNGYQQLVLREVSEAITETIKSFPDHTQQMFSMSRFEQLKYKEIAEKLGISVKTVEAHIGRVLKALRTNLKQHGMLWIGPIVLWVLARYFENHM